MIDNKEQVVMKMVSVIHDRYHIDAADVKTVIEGILDNYTITEKDGQVTASDLPEKVDFFLGVRRLDGLADRSLKRYREELSLFSRYVSKPASDVTTNDIRGYLAKIQQNRHLEKTTLNNKVRILHGFFSFLYNEDIIPSDPSKKLKTQKVDLKSLRDSLTAEELELLRDVCQNIKEKLIIEFFYSTGCRISEGIEVKVPQINWMERSILVHGKGDKDRTVFFSVKCKMLMQAYLKTRNGTSDYLFISDRKPYNQLTDNGMERAVNRIAGRTSITKSISPHVLRHTFATLALSRGMPLEMIQQLLGHSSISTTQIYAETNQRAVRAAYEQYIAA